MRESTIGSPAEIALDCASQPTILYDAEGRIIYANSAAEQWLGKTRDTLAGLESWDVYPPSMRDALEQEYYETFESSKRRTACLADADSGATYNARFTPTPAGICIQFEDVTGMRKEATSGALGIAQFSPIALFEADVAGRLVYVNSAWRALMEAGQNASIDDSWLSALHHRDRDEVSAAWKEAVRQAVPFCREVCLKSGSGAYKWVRLVTQPIVSASGHVTGFSGALEDISERRRAVADVQDLEARMDYAARELQRFAFAASHDLQEPLRVIGTFTELLARANQGKLGSESELFIQHITTGVENMRSLVQGLLDYSRAVHAEQVRPTPVDLTILLKLVLDHLKPQLDATKAQVTFDPLPTVEVNQSRFMQVFRHLLENAIRYNKRQPVIHISAERQDVEWVISVKDNGIGIDPHYHEQVFFVFKRLHSRAEYPGYGIGLAVCKAIIEHHGGQIWVESTPGEGCTFRLTLPVLD
ncbi:MAG: PAS domain-containing protein [Bryobacterales bacterium]|nr:PAS domain-containing protein [Bryobacterales bacterium]